MRSFNRDEIRQKLISFIGEMNLIGVKVDRMNLVSYSIGYFGTLDRRTYNIIQDLALSNLIEM